ncbi:MAG: hypothetical protein IKG79_08705 [Neisseriaceae bacterium]|nr:hypothetical protein [Neisseriaceae bacterium]
MGYQNKFKISFRLPEIVFALPRLKLRLRHTMTARVSGCLNNNFYGYLSFRFLFYHCQAA